MALQTLQCWKLALPCRRHQPGLTSACASSGALIMLPDVSGLPSCVTHLLGHSMLMIPRTAMESLRRWSRWSNCELVDRWRMCNGYKIICKSAGLGLTKCGACCCYKQRDYALDIWEVLVTASPFCALTGGQASHACPKMHCWKYGHLHP